MSIKITCKCGKTFSVPESPSRKSIKCHLCGNELVLNGDKPSALSPQTSVKKGPTTPPKVDKDTLGNRDMRSENFNTMVYFLTNFMVGHFRRYSAEEHIQIAEVIVRHWQKSDEQIAEEVQLAGFNLKGMMSSPSEQIARIHKQQDCEEKYRVLFGQKNADAANKGCGAAVLILVLTIIAIRIAV